MQYYRHLFNPAESPGGVGGNEHSASRRPESFEVVVRYLRS